MSRIRVELLTAAAACALAALPAPALAAPPAPMAFDIAAGRLEDALVAYAAQSQRQIAVDPGLVAGRQVPALRGAFAPGQALDRLLAGTGLVVRQTGPNAFVVRAAPPAAGGAPDAALEPAAFAGARVIADPAVAAAPDTAPATTTLDELVITGTLIRGAPAGASPVTQFDRGEIDAQGHATVADMLAHLPQNFGGAATAASAVLGSDGRGTNDLAASGVNLRGLGPAATLVLVNGRRLAGAGTKGDFADASAIPTAIIERVDVLLDGASALYGPGNWGINTTAAQQTRVTNARNALSQLVNFGGVQNWIPTGDPESNITNNYNHMHTENGGVSVTVDHDFDWATLTSISAWRLWTFDPPQDSDSSPLDIYQNMAISRSEQLSQEFRLASKNPGPVEWQIGAFLYQSKLKDHYVVHQFGADVIPWYNAYNTIAGTAFTPIPLSFRSQLTGAQIIENTYVENQNAAAYAQATWHINDAFELTGGLRYTYDRKTGSSPVDTSLLPTSLPAGVTNAQLTAFYNAIDAVQRNPGVVYTTPGYPTTPATTGYALNLETSADNISGTVSLSYKISPDITTYAAYATGFQAGGLDLNNRALDPSAPAVAPTTTDNLEVGIKAYLFDHRLTLNLAAYQSTLEGFQTSISYILPNGTPQRGATNVGDIRARGVEWSAVAALDHGLRLTFDGNYNDAIYTRAPSLPAPPELSYNGVATVDAKGQTAPYAPKWALSITPSWETQIGPETEFYAYAEYSYTSEYGTGVTQSIYTQVPSQFNLNLRAGVRLDDGKYDVSVYANNATDEKNIISQNLLAAPSGAGVTAYLGRTVNYNQPARYGVTLRAKF